MTSTSTEPRLAPTSRPSTPPPRDSGIDHCANTTGYGTFLFWGHDAAGNDFCCRVDGLMPTDVWITGSDEDDVIQLFHEGEDEGDGCDDVTVGLADAFEFSNNPSTSLDVEVWGGRGGDTIEGSPGGTDYDERLEGGRGWDRLVVRWPGAVAVGDQGDDTLIAEPSATTAVLSGQEDEDTVEAYALGVYMWGGADTDHLYAFQEMARMHGGAGDDLLDATGVTHPYVGVWMYGEGGSDVIHGSSAFGGDEIEGGDEVDHIWAYAGDDGVDAGPGADWVYGGAGDDHLDGGDGDDHLYGGGGDDVLLGGEDNDVLRGGLEQDVLCGQSGSDNLFGGQGNDHPQGGTGADVLDGGLFFYDTCYPFDVSSNCAVIQMMSHPECGPTRTLP